MNSVTDRSGEQLWIRALFVLCADHFPKGDELVRFGLTVARGEELVDLIRRIEQSLQTLKIESDEFSELKHFAGVDTVNGDHTCARMATACFRLAHRHSAVSAFIINSLQHYMLRTLADCPPPIPDIAGEIGRVFSLTKDEQRILVTLFTIECCESLGDALRAAPERTALRVVAAASGIATREFVTVTSAGGRLEQLGLIAARIGLSDLMSIRLSAPVSASFRSRSLRDLRTQLFVDTPPPRSTMEECPLSADEIIDCKAAIAGGYSILLSGLPGLGKTEFARAFAVSIGLCPHTVTTAPEFGTEANGNTPSMSTIAKVRMAASLLSSAQDLLIVDSADAVLHNSTDYLGLSGIGPETLGNAQLIHLLETLPIPAIWVTTDHLSIANSVLHRFAHIVSFPHPSVETRARMLAEYVAPLVDTQFNSLDWTREVAAQYVFTPASVERTMRIVSAELESKELTPTDVQSCVRGHFLRSSKGALTYDLRRLPSVSPAFDPRFCSTNEPLDRLERLVLHRVRAGRGIHLLLGGPPGAGKTQYALWLARKLGRDVLLKRASDLLSKYVGDSEKHIARAFRTAEETGSILILDEADALLQNRDTAVRSWEHTRIAEFLHQIQYFEGVLIACSNRVDAVDPALRRRFHKHVTFGPIGSGVADNNRGGTKSGRSSAIEAALAHIFPDVSFTEADIDTLERGPALMMSDLATTAEMMELDVVHSSRDIVRELLAAAQLRSPGRSVGF